jgi:hypothetical protein
MERLAQQNADLAADNDRLIRNIERYCMPSPDAMLHNLDMKAIVAMLAADLAAPSRDAVAPKASPAVERGRVAVGGKAELLRDGETPLPSAAEGSAAIAALHEALRATWEAAQAEDFGKLGKIDVPRVLANTAEAAAQAQARIEAPWREALVRLLAAYSLEQETSTNDLRSLETAWREIEESATEARALLNPEDAT